MIVAILAGIVFKTVLYYSTTVNIVSNYWLHYMDDGATRTNTSRTSPRNTVLLTPTNRTSRVPRLWLSTAILLTYYRWRSLSACMIFSSSFEVYVETCMITIFTPLVIITTGHPPPMEASQSRKILVASFFPSFSYTAGGGSVAKEEHTPHITNHQHATSVVCCGRIALCNRSFLFWVAT